MEVHVQYMFTMALLMHFVLIVKVDFNFYVH